jgi:DNA-binding CsgD family transcriptional regulator
MADMDPSHPSHPGVPEPPEVSALRRQSAEVVRQLAERATADHPGLRPVVGAPALGLELVRIQPMARESSRVLQPEYGYDPEDPGVPLTRLARERGVETELVTRPSTVATHPLLSSIFPRTLLGPCFLRALVVDGRQAIVGGADDADGKRVSWVTDIPELVDAVNDLWHATEPLCTPILAEGESPPLNERQLEVARLICLGEKDDAIARMLSVSVRTVEREVSTVLSFLEARSRAEAVLAMRGRGVNGGLRATGPRSPDRSPSPRRGRASSA